MLVLIRCVHIGSGGYNTQLFTSEDACVCFLIQYISYNMGVHIIEPKPCEKDPLTKLSFKVRAL